MLIFLYKLINKILLYFIALQLCPQNDQGLLIMRRFSAVYFVQPNMRDIRI